MDFAIDQPTVPRPAAKPRAAKSDPSSGEKQIEAALLGATPVEMSGYKVHPNRVRLLIKDTARRDGRLFIRYAVVNSTSRPFEITSPQVFFIVSPRSRVSLIAQHNFQLPDSEKLESNGQVSLDVIHQEVESREVGPDGQSVGVIEVKAPRSSQGPAVLRVIMPGDGQGEISAAFVL